eukprot:176706-Prymnesium_polylepis.1
MQPLPIGVRSRDSTAPQPGPSEASSALAVPDHAWGDVLSCRNLKRSQTASPNRSGRDEAHCASLITSAPALEHASTQYLHQSSSNQSQCRNGHVRTRGLKMKARNTARRRHLSTRWKPETTRSTRPCDSFTSSAGFGSTANGGHSDVHAVVTAE